MCVSLCGTLVTASGATLTQYDLMVTTVITPARTLISKQGRTLRSRGRDGTCLWGTRFNQDSSCRYIINNAEAHPFIRLLATGLVSAYYLCGAFWEDGVRDVNASQLKVMCE